MKKTFLLFAALISVAWVCAQSPAGHATVSIHHCFTTETDVPEFEIWDTQLPYTYEAPDAAKTKHTFIAGDFTNNVATYTIEGTDSRGCDDNYNVTIKLKIKPERPKVGAAWGVFKVGDSKYVYFSQGNLQYQKQNNVVRFATNQYDFIGDATVGNVSENMPNQQGTKMVLTKCSNTQIRYGVWHYIDLVGWNTANTTVTMSQYATSNTSYFRTSSTSPSAYYSKYYWTDWGNLEIQNGDNWDYDNYGGVNWEMWRTLTNTEWNYLFNSRPNAANKVGCATVCGVSGYVLLPETWDVSSYKPYPEFEWNAGCGTSYTYNSYDAPQWELMEVAGAVFLPAGGYRSGEYVTNLSTDSEIGYYWTSARYSDSQAYYVTFSASSTPSVSYDNMYYGRCVRLVQAAPAPSN